MIAVPRYTAQITRGGLLFDTMRSLALAYKPSESRAEFNARVDEQGVLAGMTAARREAVRKLFFGRLVESVSSFAALKLLLEYTSPRVQAHLLYLHTAQSDPLLRDFVTEFVSPAFYAGRVNVTLEDTVAWLKAALKAAGQTWKDSVTTKAAQSVLALLRDAGLMEGIMHKEIRFPYLSLEVATYLVYHLRALGFTTGKRVLEHPDWRLFLLEPRGVDEVLARVADAGFISWAAAGTVYQLDYRFESLEEAARVLVQ